ncbi:hypothetical protein NKG94_02440 [Micromonospora sp. M12]
MGAVARRGPRPAGGRPVAGAGVHGPVAAQPGGAEAVRGDHARPRLRADRTEAFIARNNLPMPARYDAAAQLRTFERMADDGRIKLPNRHDQPYLWFSERAAGLVGAPGEEVATTGCTMALTLSVASMYQVVRQRRIDVAGTVACPRLHAKPLTVTDGEIEVRPDEGCRTSTAPTIRCCTTGSPWSTPTAVSGGWTDGRPPGCGATCGGRPGPSRSASAGPVNRPWSRGGAGTERGVPEGPGRRAQREPAALGQAQRLAKITWLAWFYREIAKGLAEPALRAGADLLDLRRDAIDRDRDNLQRRVSKLSKDRRQLS